MARILIIDDDTSLLEALSLAFEDAGHELQTAKDGKEGLALLRSDEPDLVVSDVNMPGLDGFALCRSLREQGNVVPVILLTSRDNEVDEALGLDLGADDYVTKPFSTRSLLARVASLLRRQQLRASGGASEATLRHGDLALDAERLEVRWDGVLVEVTVTEFRLLEILAGRPGVVFTRGQLLDRLRGDEVIVGERIIDTYVRRLRRKFESLIEPFDSIETVVGAGYRWRDG